MECVICHKRILQGKYLIDSWGQIAHDYHSANRCFACARFVDEQTVCLTDGRYICAICEHAEVKDKNQINWINTYVRDVFTRIGLTNLPTNIPIELVDFSKMASLSGCTLFNPHMRGLTKTMDFGLWLSHNIYILNHTPKVIFAGILAHELLHTWQYEHHIKVPAEICEGFCNVGSYAVYSSLNHSMAKNAIKQLEANPDPIYGEGYRKVKRKLDQLGWKDLIKKMHNQ